LQPVAEDGMRSFVGEEFEQLHRQIRKIGVIYNVNNKAAVMEQVIVSL